MEIIGVILGAGQGRLGGVVSARSRGLIRIAGRGLVERHAEALVKLGIRVIAVLDEYVEVRGARIVVQRNPGIMGAILDALGEAPSSPTHILVVFADFVTSGNPYNEVLNAAIESGVESAVLVVPRPDVEGFARVEVSAGKVVGIGSGRYVFGGVALVPTQALKGDDFYVALNRYAASARVAAVHWSGKWHAVDYPWDLVYALEVALEHKGVHISPSARVSRVAVIDGPVYVDDDAEVDHYAVIKGPAYIGRGAFVGAHAFIRNYSDVEEGAVVGAYTELNHTLVEPNAFIGPHSYVAYSVVGEGAVVEPGVKTLAILREPLRRMRPIEVRGREFYKLGAFIKAGTRVPAGSVLGPGHGFA